jgi:amino acid transporter
MIATMIVPFVFNLWFRKILDAFEITGGVLHICLFIVFIVVLIVFGPKSSNEFVFETLLWQDSGWNSKGLSFGLGILPATFALTGKSLCCTSRSAAILTKLPLRL